MLVCNNALITYPGYRNVILLLGNNALLLLLGNKVLLLLLGNSLGGSSGSGSGSGTKNFPKPCSQQINIELMVGQLSLLNLIMTEGESYS